MKFDLESRGIFRLPLQDYGKSVLGSTLWYVPCRQKCRLLVVAGIHGEEPETTFLLSRCLRSFEEPFRDISFVLCANPDGMSLGTRGNVRGVDLNRNFSTANWDVSRGETLSRSILEAPRDTWLSTGTGPGSEPETAAMESLIRDLRPKNLLSMHAPMGSVDAPVKSELVEDLCSTFNLPWLPDIGYATPGSLGTWCQENGCDCVTLELPRLSLEAMFDRFGISFAAFLKNF